MKNNNENEEQNYLMEQQSQIDSTNVVVLSEVEGSADIQGLAELEQNPCYVLGYN